MTFRFINMVRAMSPDSSRFFNTSEAGLLHSLVSFVWGRDGSDWYLAVAGQKLISIQEVCEEMGDKSGDADSTARSILTYLEKLHAQA